MTSGKAVIQTQDSLLSLHSFNSINLLLPFPGFKMLPVSDMGVSDRAVGLWEAFWLVDMSPQGGLCSLQLSLLRSHG